MIRFLGSFSFFLISFLLRAAADSPYTKCTSLSTASSSLMSVDQWCLPEPGASLNTSVKVKRFEGDLDVTFVVAGLQNCRTPGFYPSGTFVFIVDNSSSLIETDPDHTRLRAVQNYLSKVLDETQSSFDATNPLAPRLGSLAYAGRPGVVETNEQGQIAYEADGLNPVFTKTGCQNNEDFTGSIYPSDAHFQRWNQRDQNNQLISQCEFLPLVSLSQRGDRTANTSDRQMGFLSENTTAPRGATDYTYMYEPVLTNQFFASSEASPYGRNLIVLSDGLPDIPYRVPQATCQARSDLRSASVFTDSRGQSFCYDNQFRLGVQQAHEFVEDQILFRSINIHHILYSNGQLRISEDDQGQLNPADFLIENSARSGDGSVKFYFPENEEALLSTLGMIGEVTGERALQRIEIQVNGPHQDTYQAVSRGQFDARFDLKFVGLQDGTYTIKVIYVYGDGTAQQTWTVEVGSEESSDVLKCVGNVNGALTVDGDDRASLQPRGDGFFPRRDDGGHIRSYRNAHTLNNLSGEYAFFRGEPGKDPRQMRLQGGAGNLCGVVASQGRVPSFFFLFLFLFLGLKFFRIKGKEEK